MKKIMRKENIRSWMFGIAVLLAVMVFGMVGCKDPTSDETNDETNMYTVTFNANNGSENTTQKVAWGVKITEPDPAPVKEDHVFGGWYREEGFTTKWNFAVDTVSDDITLYAKWLASIKVEMVPVAGGSFEMGNPDTTVGDSNERPVHKVTVSGFYMGKYEVTQAQYEAVMGTNLSWFTLANRKEPVAGEIAENRPVETVSWYDALVFCNKLSMLEGLTPVYSIRESTNTALWGSIPRQSDLTWSRVTCNWEANGYRMPTEAEWEYAARGGNGSPGNFIYAGSNTVDDVAWYNTDSDTDVTHEVGKKLPNSLGLYDMSGNVDEWCWDGFGDYTDEAQMDPVGYSEKSWYDGVCRGGAWLDSAAKARSVNRSIESMSRRFYGHGLRLVRRP